MTVVKNSGRILRPIAGIIRQHVLETSIARVLIDCNTFAKVATLYSLK